MEGHNSFLSLWMVVARSHIAWAGLLLSLLHVGDGRWLLVSQRFWDVAIMCRQVWGATEASQQQQP